MLCYDMIRCGVLYFFIACHIFWCYLPLLHFHYVAYYLVLSCLSFSLYFLSQLPPIISSFDITSLSLSHHTIFTTLSSPYYSSGVAAVFNLVCSDHAMVRRAATEIFCNMAGHDAVLKVRTSYCTVRYCIVRYCTVQLT